MTQTTDTAILIVGAGLSGLMAANALAKRGLRPHVIDKGDVVGGRLATRRLGNGHADHGAQFFTVRDAQFQTWVDEWKGQELVYQWSTGWSDGSLAATAPDGFPRYAVRGGMNALAKVLAAQAEAAGATIRTGVRLTRATQEQARWVAYDEAGNVYAAQTLVLTPPVPQSVALLAAGAVELTPADQTALARIAYAPCLCGLFWVEGDVELPAPGAIQRPGEPISWIADNRRKGISDDATVLTVHAGPDWSRHHYDEDDARLLSLLAEAVTPWLAPHAQIRDGQLKRWRYALPTSLHPARYLRGDTLPPLYFAGDAFGGPRVEGAALSGLAVAAAIV